MSVLDMWSKTTYHTTLDVFYSFNLILLWERKT